MPQNIPGGGTQTHPHKPPPASTTPAGCLAGAKPAHGPTRAGPTTPAGKAAIPKQINLSKASALPCSATTSANSTKSPSSTHQQQTPSHHQAQTPPSSQSPPLPPKNLKGPLGKTRHPQPSPTIQGWTPGPAPTVPAEWVGGWVGQSVSLSVFPAPNVYTACPHTLTINRTPLYPPPPLSLPLNGAALPPSTLPIGLRGSSSALQGGARLPKPIGASVAARPLRSRAHGSSAWRAGAAQSPDILRGGGAGFWGGFG